VPVLIAAGFSGSLSWPYHFRSSKNLLFFRETNLGAGINRPLFGIGIGIGLF
jgi:hypothetical protein